MEGALEGTDHSRFMLKLHLRDWEYFDSQVQ